MPCSNNKFQTIQKESQFLSYKASFKPVARCLIASCQHVVMEEPGIHTSIFKAHSSGVASTSKPQMQGLSTTQITE